MTSTANATPRIELRGITKIYPSVVANKDADKACDLLSDAAKKTIGGRSCVTTLEAGFPNSEYVFWIGVFAPASTPRAPRTTASRSTCR